MFFGGKLFVAFKGFLCLASALPIAAGSTVGNSVAGSAPRLSSILQLYHSLKKRLIQQRERMGKHMHSCLDHIEKRWFVLLPCCCNNYDTQVIEYRLDLSGFGAWVLVLAVHSLMVLVLVLLVLVLVLRAAGAAAAGLAGAGGADGAGAGGARAARVGAAAAVSI